LEEQNPLFFKAYQLRLRVKDQIAQFNSLVSEQANAMRAYHTSDQQVSMMSQQQNPSQMPTSQFISPLVQQQSQLLQPQTHSQQQLEQPLPTSVASMAGILSPATQQMPDNLFMRAPQQQQLQNGARSLMTSLLFDDQTSPIGTFSQYDEEQLSGSSPFSMQSYGGAVEPDALNLNLDDNSDTFPEESSLWYDSNRE
jgi:hypothetical protein